MPVWAIVLTVLSGTALTPRGVHAQNAPVGQETLAPRLTKPPKLVKFVEAEYPEAEKSQGKTAAVVLQIAIDETGKVSGAEIVQSSGPNFDNAALEAVKQFEFEPAEINGVPGPIRIHYRYDFVFKEELPTGALFEGVVRLKGGSPLPGVTVALDDGATTVTDAEGRFRFESLEPGKRQVLLSRDDLKGLQTEETLEAGQKLSASYEVEEVPEPSEDEEEEADDLEIVVTAPRLTKQTVSVRVDASDAKRVAGTQGDVLKIVENLPGVARATAGSGRVVVWGAAPEDTRVYVDGVRVPLLYHFGGLRSVIHSDLVQSVELIPGAYGAAYGRGLGGIVRVEGKDPAEDRLHGSVQLDLLDASAAAHGPVAGNNSFSIGGRRSHLNSIIEAVADDDVDEFFPIPRYWDGQARFRHNFSTREYAEVFSLVSSDRLSRSTISADPADRKRETRSLDFQRLAARYRNTSEDGSVTEALPWVGHDRSSLDANFSGKAISLELDTWLAGFRSSWTGRVASFLTASVGVDVEFSMVDAARAGSFSLPAREGDARPWGQPPSSEVSEDTWKVASGSAAPFIEGDFELFSGKLHVVPGLRLDPYFVSVNRRVPKRGNVADVGAFTSDLALEPRISLRYAPSERIGFKLGYGQYRQPPLPEDLSAQFGNPLLGPASGRHFLAGAAFELFKGFHLEATGFLTMTEHLAVRNPLESPLVAEALLARGEGRSYGAQFLLRRDLSSGFFGWVAYTILRAERRNGPEFDWRLFDYDQTHVLTALAAYELGKGFDVGARIRYSSGYPRTPVVGAYLDSTRGTYEPRLGALNSDRLPDFVQADLRVAKRWSIAGTELETYLDLQNVTNRENAEELAYSKDYSERRYIYGLPILPVVGANWSF